MNTVTASQISQQLQTTRANQVTRRGGTVVQTATMPDDKSQQMANKGALVSSKIGRLMGGRSRRKRKRCKSKKKSFAKKK
jgi:hypothetical protein